MNNKNKTRFYFIYAALLLLGVTFAAITNAQTKVQQDAQGNYIQVKKERKAKPATDTGKTFTDSKGNTYKVYQSERGKLFVIRKSAKTGKERKEYITL